MAIPYDKPVDLSFFLSRFTTCVYQPDSPLSSDYCFCRECITSYSALPTFFQKAYGLESLRFATPLQHPERLADVVRGFSEIKEPRERLQRLVLFFNDELNLHLVDILRQSVKVLNNIAGMNPMLSMSVLFFGLDIPQKYFNASRYDQETDGPFFFFFVLFHKPVWGPRLLDQLAAYNTPNNTTSMLGNAAAYVSPDKVRELLNQLKYPFPWAFMFNLCENKYISGAEFFRSMSCVQHLFEASLSPQNGNSWRWAYLFVKQHRECVVREGAVPLEARYREAQETRLQRLKDILGNCLHLSPAKKYDDEFLLAVQPEVQRRKAYDERLPLLETVLLRDLGKLVLDYLIYVP